MGSASACRPFEELSVAAVAVAVAWSFCSLTLTYLFKAVLPAYVP
jgi:hypothetical protein